MAGEEILAGAGQRVANRHKPSPSDSLYSFSRGLVLSITRTDSGVAFFGIDFILSLLAFFCWLCDAIKNTNITSGLY
jgi:hypothetical protein